VAAFSWAVVVPSSASVGHQALDALDRIEKEVLVGLVPEDLMQILLAVS